MGLPTSSEVESSSTSYGYSDDDSSKLLSICEDNGIRVTFTYDSDRRHDRQIPVRTCRAASTPIYALRCGTLIETILDDGTSLNATDTTGVTERHITAMTTRQQSPGFGLPILIDEKVWDNTLGCAKPRRTAIRSYDAKGRLVKEERFDAASDHCGTTDYQYDARGRLVSGDDAVQYAYDLAGRVIRKEVKDAEGKLYTTHFRYNALGQRVETIDMYGNVSQYTYDSLGRCLSTGYPAIATASGSTLQPTISQSYDVLNRPTSIQDPNGYRTQFHYNVRGKPVAIVHPDGTRELYTYALDGSQTSHTNRQGCVTHEQRDAFGRVFDKSTVAADGNAVSSQAFYNSFRLVGTVNPTGEQSLFSYDSAGRIIEAKTLSAQCEQQLSFHYDSHGRLQEARQCFGCDSQDVSCLLLDHDSKSGVSARITDGDHNTLVAKDYLRPPECTPDVHCDIDFVNSLGQKVLRKTTTDALGKRTIMTHDALGHVVEIEEQNICGQRLSHRQFYYDAAGHCVVDQNNALDGSSAWIVTKRFGPMNRLEALSEGVGTPFEAHTTYCYHANGLLEQIVKPKGISLHYEYDGFGRLIHLYSSDKTVDYHYQHDAHGRPTLIADLVHGTTSHCHYGPRGELLQEQMDHGPPTRSPPTRSLTVAYERDAQGRTTKLTLPDESSIIYDYDAVLLRSITRQDSAGKTCYVHTYDRYSSTGHLESEKLIRDLGVVTYACDDKGRRSAIQSPYWSERIATDAYDAAGNITQLEITDPKGPYRMRFAYDCQGQLAGEAGVAIHPYTYDALHNRTSQGISQHVINSANQVVNTPDTQYTYDANGNRVTKQTTDQITHYTYDALDRLISAETPHQQRVEYRYDASHRRISKATHIWDDEKATWVPQPTLRYIYDGKREIGALDEQGTIQELRVLGLGIAGDIGAAVALEINSELYAPIHDHRGSVACLVNATTGKVADIPECRRMEKNDSSPASQSQSLPHRRRTPGDSQANAMTWKPTWSSSAAATTILR